VQEKRFRDSNLLRTCLPLFRAVLLGLLLCPTFNVTVSSTTDGISMFRNRAERVRSTCWSILPVTEGPLDSVLVGC
jgi:hypothetical protein